ncbi:FadR/GntR family transcriptional regulator [Amycolatopsis thermoflava]|uniref:GntR family transcriptional regulator n=1 Tax=Amycolatopsis thermoflava TaxID=84480 RepID=A0A3N2GQB5_9PSEU|nr:FadR/GntR family transcriptional regulator [Amycolatopsis thermoflava]ROS38580.1 GntR family transcriptional regulator [Amycolatopsis thermoflava]
MELGEKILRPREQVEQALKKAILSSKLGTGERLPSEAELARQFGVSRPTIREALSSLQMQGLIRRVPGAGGGSFVQPVDHKSLGEVVRASMQNLVRLGSVDFEEVSMVRQYLEVPCAALAAENRGEEDLEELRQVVHEQRTRSVDDPMIAELDVRFHTIIARMSGNRVLASLVYALHHESEPVRYLDLSPEVGRHTVAQHQRIVQAIEDKDPQAAEAAITEHLAYLRKHIKAALADIPAEDSEDRAEQGSPAGLRG